MFTRYCSKIYIPVLDYLKNQQDIVTSLINDEHTSYYVKKDNLDLYNKQQTRLKTYISQLLSATANRTLTDEFKTSLYEIIRKKINDNEIAQDIVNKLVLYLRENNSASVKPESKKGFNESFINDFSSAAYIVIITGKPLEIEADFDAETFSLRNIFFDDFFNFLEGKGSSKYYRLNFPLKESADLFWSGIRKTLIKYFKDRKKDHELFLHIEKKIFPDYKVDDYFNEEAGADNLFIEKFVIDVLKYLNKMRLLNAFVVRSPIFTIPTIALDPANTKTFMMYSIMDGEEQSVLHKYSEKESMLWRFFVWDRLKSFDDFSDEVPFVYNTRR